MNNIVSGFISALVAGFAVCAFSFSVAAYNGDGVRNVTPDVVQARKCKKGYYLDKRTNKCRKVPSGSY